MKSAVFADIATSSIPLALIPLRANALGASATETTAIVGAFFVAQVFGASAMSRFAERFGKRPALVSCFAGSAVALFAACEAGSLLALFLARSVAGLFGASSSLAHAAVVEERRCVDPLVRVSAWIAAAFVAGGLAAAVLAPFGFHVACAAAGVLAALNCMWASARLEEPRSTQPPVATPARPKERIAVVLIASFLFSAATMALDATIALHLLERFRIDGQKISVVLTAAAGAYVLIQLSFAAVAIRRFGALWTAVFGGALSALSLAIIPIAPTIELAACAIVVCSIGESFVWPAVAMLMLEESGARATGAFGLQQSVASGSAALTMFAAGFLYELGAPLPYLAGGLMALLAGVLLLRARPSRSRTR